MGVLFEGFDKRIPGNTVISVETEVVAESGTKSHLKNSAVWSQFWDFLEVELPNHLVFRRGNFRNPETAFWGKTGSLGLNATQYRAVHSKVQSFSAKVKAAWEDAILTVNPQGTASKPPLFTFSIDKGLLAKLLGETTLRTSGQRQKAYTKEVKKEIAKKLPSFGTTGLIGALVLAVYLLGRMRL